uniref:Uncharacterized protein n=1 Tax=Amphimedon queenslandica TaxID=400682 RepID=A0A1X7SGG3_AMPQE
MYIYLRDLISLLFTLLLMSCPKYHVKLWPSLSLLIHNSQIINYYFIK